MITLTKNYDLNSQHEMAAVPPLLLNVKQALANCGIDNVDHFREKNAAEIISEEVFDDRSSLIMDISQESVEDPFN